MNTNKKLKLRAGFTLVEGCVVLFIVGFLGLLVSALGIGIYLLVR